MILSKSLAGVIAAEIGHVAPKYREGGNCAFEETASTFWISCRHGPTVRRAGARVARQMKNIRYDFVVIDAESSGGVLRDWKTTQ